MASVNTNYGALVALQSLNQTTKQLADVQNHVNTGLKVSSAKDNGAVFAIAEGQRARVSALGAVQDGIDRASSTIDVALSAGQAIGDILKQLKEQAVAAEATDLSQDQRDALQANFASYRDQIDQIANAATFNGSNLVNGTNLTGGANELTVLTSDTAGAGSGSYTFTGATTDPGDGSGIRSANNTFDAATGSGFSPAAGGGVEFALTDANGNVTQYYAALDDTTTIQDFVDAVSVATNGKVTADYDDTTGKITYSSTSAFTATYLDDITDDTSANGTDNGILSGTLAAASGGGAGTNSLAVSGFDFRLGKSGQALEGITSSLDISSSTNASAASDAIDAAITALNKNLATLGAQSKALDVQKTFLGQLSDSITAGIGNLVDADLAKESAQLQALQVKQQLGAQALSIANSAPSIVLSFFK